MLKKNINNFPIIKETSLHRIVEMVRNNDDTLLRDSKTGEYVKTSDYLGVDVDKQGNVTKIYTKQPFYWECWDFEEDIDWKDINNPIIQYNFGIYFYYIEIGFVKRQRGCGEIYFSNDVIFFNVTFSNNANFEHTTFSNDVIFFNVTFSKEANFRYATFSGEANFRYATFSNNAYFMSAIFSNKANFEDTTFSNQVNFEDIIFYNEANFRYVTFSKYVYFMNATFSGEANFMSATFSKDVCFMSATFSGEANFWQVIFSNEADFLYVTFSNNANFWLAIFSGKANFRHTTFSNNANFWHATFSGKANFRYAIFSNETNFRSATFFSGAYMMDLKFMSKELLVDFADCNIENKIIFGLFEDNVNVYKKLIFGLYCSNINYFICDDKALEHVQLYWDNPIREDDKELEERTKIECCIHELRVMRKIFQDLLWGDIADEYYAKLMDKQTKLELHELWRNYPKLLFSARELFKRPTAHNPDKKLPLKKSNYIKYLKGLLSKKMLLTLRWLFLKKLFFKYCFGWGVRLKNIFLTGFGVITLFSLIYLPQKISYDVGSDAITMNTQNFLHSLLFSVWTFFNIFLPDLQVTAFNSSASLFFVTVESLLGIIWMTLIVAILSRKFMRL